VAQKLVAQSFVDGNLEVIKRTVHIINPTVSNLLVFICMTFFCIFH